MNILLINHYAGSPEYGMEFRPYYLGREWVGAGHRVRIIAGSYSHIRAKQPKVAEGSHSMECIDGIEFCWYDTFSYAKNGIGRVISMLNFIWHLWRDAKKIVADFRPDIVIASSTYPMDIWPAKKIADLVGAKLVFEVHDLWPLSPIELGNMSRWHPFIIWVQLSEDYAYRCADKVVSILPKTLDYMVSRGLAPQKWSHIPNGIELGEWQTHPELPIDIKNSINSMKALGLPIICYAGTHGLANALDVLLDAAALLRGRAQVLLVGSGPERERLLQRVIRENLDNVLMLPSIPKSLIPSLLAKIDIAYIGWHSNPLYRFGISPNKLMDYMMASKVIIHSVNAGNDPVFESGCGLTVAPGDPDAIVVAVQQLLQLDLLTFKKMGELGREFIEKNMTYSVLAKNFLSACHKGGSEN